jgi:hypothetical protein
VLAIQNEIAHELVGALLPRLGMDPQTPLLPLACCNHEAYELCLKLPKNVEVSVNPQSPDSPREAQRRLSRS